MKQFTITRPDEELTEIQKEYEFYRQLEHPNIVKQHGFYYGHGVAKIYMEYVPGGSVASVLKQFGYLHEMIIANYIRQVLEGLRCGASHIPSQPTTPLSDPPPVLGKPLPTAFCT